MDTLDPDYPDVAQSYNNFGDVYEKKGAYDKAIEYLEKTLTIALSTLGPEHPHTQQTKQMLARLVQADNNEEEEKKEVQ